MTSISCSLPIDWKVCATQLVELPSSEWARYQVERLGTDVPAAFGLLCIAGLVRFEGELSLEYRDKQIKKFMRGTQVVARPPDRIRAMWQGDWRQKRDGNKVYRPLESQLMESRFPFPQGWEVVGIGNHPRFVSVTLDGQVAQKSLSRPTPAAISTFIRCLRDNLAPCVVSIRAAPVQDDAVRETVVVNNIQFNTQVNNNGDGFTDDDRATLQNTKQGIDGIQDKLEPEAKQKKPRAIRKNMSRADADGILIELLKEDPAKYAGMGERDLAKAVGCSRETLRNLPAHEGIAAIREELKRQ